MSDIHTFEKIYSSPGAAIWTQETPPEKLIEFIDMGIIKPGKALDSACGEGTAAVYLAQKEFDVTGIDFSEKAIEYAKARANKEGVNPNFLQMNALEIEKLAESFDFIFEWGLLHHLNPNNLQSYFEKINTVLAPNGLYMTNSFNDQSNQYGYKGQKVRKTPLGTELFYYSQEEMTKKLSHYFDIIEQKIVPMIGKGISQPGNFFLLGKRLLE